MVRGEDVYLSPMSFFVEGPIHDTQCIFKRKSNSNIFSCVDGCIVFKIENQLSDIDVKLNAIVIQPSGVSINVPAEQLTDMMYIFKYVPLEIGSHSFVVENKGRQIIDSPRKVHISATAHELRLQSVQFPDIKKSKINVNHTLKLPVLVSAESLEHLKVSCFMHLGS